jgi:DNA-binding TFAR19-related protein (PDSD5 family)
VKQVLSRLRFADARLVRSELERQLEDMLKNLSLSDKVNVAVIFHS